VSPSKLPSASTPPSSRRNAYRSGRVGRTLCSPTFAFHLTGFRRYERADRSVSHARRTGLRSGRSGGLGAVLEFVIDSASDPRRHGPIVSVDCIANLGERVGREPVPGGLGQVRVAGVVPAAWRASLSGSPKESYDPGAATDTICTVRAHA
jgi:hypothetical protein